MKKNKKPILNKALKQAPLKLITGEDKESGTKFSFVPLPQFDDPHPYTGTLSAFLAEPNIFHETWEEYRNLCYSPSFTERQAFDQSIKNLLKKLSIINSKNQPNEKNKK